MTTIALKAFEKFEQETAEYPYNYMRALEDAVSKIGKTEPSRHLKQRWSDHFGGEMFVPEQLKRDMLIVDYMVQRKSVPFDVANEMWSDWESYEYELKGGK